MAAPAFTKDEIAFLQSALQAMIQSSVRAQNTKGRSPAVKAVYERQEKQLRELEQKLTNV